MTPHQPPILQLFPRRRRRRNITNAPKIELEDILRSNLNEVGKSIGGWTAATGGKLCPT